MSRAVLTDPQHVTRSLLRSSPVSAPTGVPAVEWLRQRQSANTMTLERVPLEALQSWRFDTTAGALTHTSGKFFRMEGLAVTSTQGARQAWEQPIINQPEVGILGILARKFGGVLHFLMQAKVEPGNPNGVQLAPTVQATVSNYTRAHNGKEVAYLDYFRTPTRRTVRPIVDVRQSEQGSWFLRKRNRNMVVETTDEVPVLDGFAWLTLGDVHDLLSCGDRVSMSARSVLSCLPLTTRFRPDSYPMGSPFAEALVDSLIADPADDGTALRTLLQWITDVRTRHACSTAPVRLDRVQEWGWQDGRIAHESGDFFEVIGMRVRAGDREVTSWDQPLIAPTGQDMAAFVVKPIRGTLHVLVRARVEPGLCDVAEIAPTVQCRPATMLRHGVTGTELDLLSYVLGAPEHRVRFSAELCEEGGRLYRAQSRYSIVEAEADFTLEHPDYRWVSLDQLSQLLAHSHYVNVQARTLITCLAGLSR